MVLNAEYQICPADSCALQVDIGGDNAVGKNTMNGAEPPGKKTNSGKKTSRSKSKPIVIKGSGTRFDGIYDVDELFFKLMAFVAVVCILALIFL